MKILLTLPLLLAACAASSVSMGRDLTLDDALQIKLGETTAAELPVLLGPPAITTRDGVSSTQYGAVATPDQRDQMVWTHTKSTATGASALIATASSGTATTERLTVFLDPETGCAVDWLFEGEVNGAWQTLKPGDEPLTAAEVRQIRGEPEPRPARPRDRYRNRN